LCWQLHCWYFWCIHNTIHSKFRQVKYYCLDNICSLSMEQLHVVTNRHIMVSCIVPIIKGSCVYHCRKDFSLIFWHAWLHN
jgi:hypothetical protein